MATANAADRLRSQVRALHQLVRRTRQRLRLSWVSAGMGVTVGLSLTVLMIAGTLDWVLVLSTPARYLAWTAIVTTGSVCLIGRVLRPALARLSETDVALWIERTIPQMHSRLVSALDLSRQPATDGSTAFYTALVEQAAQKTANFQPAAVLDRQSLSRAAWWTALALSILLLGLGLAPRFVTTTLARVLMPWADIPPPSSLLLFVAPGDAEALQGNAVTISVDVAGGSVKEVQLQLTTDDGAVRRIAMTPKDHDRNRFEHTVEQLQESLTYRVFAGRTWTRKLRLSLVERPRVVSLRTEVHPPDYLADVRPVESTQDVGAVSGPVGSRARVCVLPEGQVSSGQLRFFDEHVDISWTSDPLTARMWFEDQLPAGSKLTGCWQWDWSQKFRRTHTEPEATSTQGHGFEDSVGFPVHPGDILFCRAWIDSQRAPEQICIELTDDTGWRHRAVWGPTDSTRDDQQTASRGSVPSKGRWARLEIPARPIGAEGKRLKGLKFIVRGGVVRWDSFGACSGRENRQRELQATRQVSLQRDDAGWWAGDFLVDHDEYYRIELTNARGYSSQAGAEYPVRAVPDRPPTLAVERPGDDITLSSPIAVPVVVHAADDFGLAELSVDIQLAGRQKRMQYQLRRFDDPTRAETVYSSLALAPLDLTLGEELLYVFQVSDRKGQSARSRQFRIRLQDTAGALDKQIAEYEKQRAALREALGELADRQRGINNRAHQLAESSQALSEDQPPTVPPAPTDVIDQPPSATTKAALKAKFSVAEPGRDSVAVSPPTDPAPSPRPGERQSLRQALLELSRHQESNRGLAREVAGHLKEAIKSSARMSVLPITQQQALQDLGQDFARATEKPLAEAGKQMRELAQTVDRAQAVEPVANLTDAIQRELEALVRRLEQLDQLEQAMLHDPQLLDDMLAERERADLAGATEQTLRNLLEALGALGGDVDRLTERQEELEATARQADDDELEEIVKQQLGLEDDAVPTLEDIQKMLASTQAKDLSKARPDHDQRGEFETLKRRQQDTNAGQNADRPSPSPTSRRGQLGEKQKMLHKDLNQAGQMVSERSRQLQSLQRQLQSMLGDASLDLDALLRSPEMREQLRMAKQMRQLDRFNQPADQRLPTGIEPGQILRRGRLVDGRANAVDLAAEAAKLSLGQRDRQELLQAIGERGPESYREHIRDYYNRLTQIKP